jgi:hypothetical protein
MPTKESRELYLAERFFPELLKDQPFTLSQPAPPLPDIVVETQDKKIGIEITALIFDEEGKRRESDQGAILREAQKLFEEKYQLPLHVTVSFEEVANWKQHNRRQIAHFIASNVMRFVAQVRSLPQYETQFDFHLDDVAHSHIQGIDIFYLNRLTIPCYESSTSFVVPSVSIEKIQEVINRKSQNVTGYLKGCDEVWLLIIETGSPSSYFEHFDKLKEDNFASGFSRTLIGRISKGELLVLETKPQI